MAEPIQPSSRKPSSRKPSSRIPALAPPAAKHDRPIRLTRAQSREIDRRASEDYHVPGIVLMENAALAAANLACEMLDGIPSDYQIHVAIICGGGNNGGDGLAIARHLHNRGVPLQIYLTTDPAHYRGDALINWQTVAAMKLACTHIDLGAIAKQTGLIIDAIFGTGLSEPPRGHFADLVAAIARSSAAALAIDIPSGLDCDTGKPLGPACVKATRTITFVAEKAGFAEPASRQYTGPVTIGDIGCPRELIAAVCHVDQNPAPPAKQMD